MFNNGPLVSNSKTFYMASLKFKSKLFNKMKTKKYHTVGTMPKPHSKIVERIKIDTTNTQIHGLSLSWLGTSTSIKSGGVETVFYGPKPP